MHESCMEWVQGQSLSGPTLDVGSYDVNGSPRSYFPGRYVGVDMRAGPGVDLVCASAHLPLPNDEFQTVLWLNTLEHDRYPWLTAREIHRVLRPGGDLLVSVPDFGYVLHEYPSDYWRLSQAGIAGLLEDAGFAVASNDLRDGCWLVAAHKE